MPAYGLPVPATWVSGPMSAALLRANVTDAIALLSQPPKFIGEQTTTAQSISNNTYTAVQLDTEIDDNLNSHQISPALTNPNYYCSFPGWYLCQASVPVNISGTGTTVVGVAVGGVQNGGADTNYGGQRITPTAGSVSQAVACKLMKLQIATGFSTGDYVHASVQEVNSGSLGATLTNTATNFPQLSARWVAALSGTTGLPVPSNPAWPAPTADVTSAFANANIRDTIRFLIYPPIMEFSGASGSVASSTPLTATTGTAVTLTTSTVDNYSAYSAGTWTAPVGGTYFCYGCVALNTGANANSIAAGLTVTSANYNSGTTFTIWGGVSFSVTSAVAAQVIRKRLRLNAGDTIQLAASQFDGGSASASYASGVHVPRLITVWQGA